MARTRWLKLLLLIALGALLEQEAGAQQARQRSRAAQVQKSQTQKQVRPPLAPGRDATPEKPTERLSAPADAEISRVTGIRFLSSKSYTRVMLDLSRAVRYETRRLKEDAAKGLPPRVYVDVFGAQLALASKEPLPVEDGLLRQVRVGQFSQDVVRVVLDMTSVREYNAFLLPEPSRLVIDIHGQTADDAVAARTQGKNAPGPAKQKKTAPAGIRKIVLDPGHGGKDPGAIGVGGIAEKDIVLRVAKRLAAKLKKEMGLEVVLTRNDDRYISLEDRTAIANAEEADLFISLHMNASPNGDARGLETYYLDNTNDEAAIRLAARENGTTRQNISDLQFILSDMTQNVKLEDSITLAHRLQSALVDGVSKKISDFKDLGVKKALFYVLVGARMPSVLVELFFITNKTEARAMSQESYQESVVNALFEGIQKYAQSAVALKTL